MNTTTKPTVESMNRVIAEFMELEKCQRCQEDCGHYKYSGAYFTPAEMSYNCSWDWLMPVYKKLRAKLSFDFYGKENAPFLEALIHVNISKAHQAVYEAI